MKVSSRRPPAASSRPPLRTMITSLSLIRAGGTQRVTWIVEEKRRIIIEDKE